ncbi:hypothetical protein QAD02_022676 [Eretmocerus hayati]|uniref:Uncharacterized protein n=1 Tax=Eretmocerus hayati TaxID=131215 RepID=A0ACC2PTZ6_9HYME|nr:hypothetical protein QAD02_022676 [Eretmocerus hayati]
MDEKSSTIAINDNHKDHEKCKVKDVSTCRNAASQFFAAFATNIVMFVSGSFFGFTTILLAEVGPHNGTKTSEIEVSDEEETWLGSYLFMQPIGALLVGIIAHRIGSRRTVVLGSLLFGTSCIIFRFASNSFELLVAQAIVALSSVNAQGITYAVEITEPHLRTTIMSTMNFSSTCGALFVTILAYFLYWRTVIVVIFFIDVVGLVAMLYIPDSPHYLASMNRFDEAEAALAWLRGWTSIANVKSELDALRADHDRANIEVESFIHKTKQVSSLPANPKSKSHELCIRPFLTRNFLLPLISVCYIFIVRAFTGTMTIQIFASRVFDVIFGNLNKSYNDGMLIASYAVDITGATIFTLCVNSVGKRRLMSISLLLAALSYGTVSVFVAMIHRGSNSAFHIWVPAATILLSILVTTAGVDSIVSMVNGELFPSKLRNVGAGIGMFVNYTCQALVNKMFISAVDYLGLEGVFLVFTSMCTLGLVTFYFILPDTEGRTLAEIEDHYAGKRSLKSRRTHEVS